MTPNKILTALLFGYIMLGLLAFKFGAVCASNFPVKFPTKLEHAK